MSATYVSGPYTSGQLLRDVRAVEDAITRHFIERGPITAPADQKSMADRLLDVSGGRNTVMFDSEGNPSIMVRFPAYTLDRLGMGGSNGYRTLHPAFIVNGKAIPEFWIGKYQAGRGENNLAVSLRGVDSWVSIDFGSAITACEGKGEGWHLVTNAEWAAIALWCRANGYYPRGNNQYGRDYQRTDERGEATSISNGVVNRVGTGTGPASWSHDGSPFGIWDLNGNVWEWVDGLKLVNGRIYVHHDNDFDTGNSEGSVDGWVDTERYFDNSVPGDDQETSHKVGGSIVLNTTRENPMYTGGDTNSLYGENNQQFKSIEAKQGVTVPDLLRYLAIMPPEDVSNIAGDRLYVRNYGERLARRGGSWGGGADAGLFCLNLGDPRSSSAASGGFRAAFVS